MALPLHLRGLSALCATQELCAPSCIAQANLRDHERVRHLPVNHRGARQCQLTTLTMRHLRAAQQPYSRASLPSAEARSLSVTASSTHVTRRQAHLPPPQHNNQPNGMTSRHSDTHPQQPTDHPPAPLRCRLRAAPHIRPAGHPPGAQPRRGAEADGWAKDKDGVQWGPVPTRGAGGGGGEEGGAAQKGGDLPTYPPTYIPTVPD